MSKVIVIGGSSGAGVGLSPYIGKEVASKQFRIDLLGFGSLDLL